MTATEIALLTAVYIAIGWVVTFVFTYVDKDFPPVLGAIWPATIVYFALFAVLFLLVAPFVIAGELASNVRKRRDK